MPAAEQAPAEFQGGQSCTGAWYEAGNLWQPPSVQLLDAPLAYDFTHGWQDAHVGPLVDLEPGFQHLQGLDGDALCNARHCARQEHILVVPVLSRVLGWHGGV
jgi:hypothetical protein